MDPTRNHSDSPLVTAQIMMCEKDLHLLPRALASVLKQGLAGTELEIQLVYDGRLPEEASRQVNDLAKQSTCYINLYQFPEASGYYCAPRNRATQYAWGHYIAHLDVDNEWRPGHLLGLLSAIRIPDPDRGWPHFVYARRTYVRDPGAPENLPTGDSPLTEWDRDSCSRLQLSPQNNFIDTGDFLIGKSALYELAERTGCIWDSNLTRFGDWDLVRRLAQASILGRAVDQVSHVYHWTDNNVQHTRKVDDFVTIPVSTYERMREQGLIRE